MRALVREAVDKGWRVVLIRIPVGGQMLAMETALPEDLHLEAAARELNVLTVDYQYDPRLSGFTTVDESHLTPEAARRMAEVLADDVRVLLTRYDDLQAGRSEAAPPLHGLVVPAAHRLPPGPAVGVSNGGRK